MCNKTLFLLLFCATAGISAMDTSSASSSSAASDFDEDDALVDNIKRNLTFSTPAEAKAAIPAEPWERIQKITVLEICRRMLHLSRTATKNDIARYYSLARRLQHKMAACLDEKAAHNIMGMKADLHTAWATFGTPINNWTHHARLRIMGYGPQE